MTFLKVTGLTVKLLLAACANLLDQERAFGAVNLVGVTVVLDGRMATGRAPLAIESALGR
jgi:hypothetical protein